ncbi:MAG: glycosyltransferase family 4 protein [Candidatus Poriferisodalaceae bacterium]
MKIDFVVPRYGPVGGAENAVSALASRVATKPGWQVRLHATCATSSNSWVNDKPPGASQFGPLTVCRYLVDSGRTDAWSSLDRRIQSGTSSVDNTTQDEFFFHQGPVSNDLANAVQDSDADLVFFAPYLFWTTMAVAPLVADRAVIIPAAHDESFLKLSRVGDLLQQSQGLIYGSRAEQQLLQRTHPIGHLPSTVLGWGIETPLDGDPEILAKFGLGDRPYAICVGRIEHAKGTLGLVDFWRTLKSRCDTDQQLVLLGSPSIEIESDGDVIITREVDDEAKWSLLRGADFLINPSALESFSLVLFEAWAAGIPVLVNGYCETTRTHVTEAQGGLWYRNYPEFELAVERLATDKATRNRLAENGKAFGERNYGWNRLVSQFTEFCHHVS